MTRRTLLTLAHISAMSLAAYLNGAAVRMHDAATWLRKKSGRWRMLGEFGR